jgi:hypothetical protein
MHVSAYTLLEALSVVCELVACWVCVHTASGRPLASESRGNGKIGRLLPLYAPL